MDDRLQHYISRIETSKNLPTLPHILVKLINTCKDENGSIQDIAKIIRADASISAKILKLANSSYFRSTEKIVQIDHALIRMGREAVKNLAISSAVHQVFIKSGIVSNGFNLKRFWRHSLTSAVLARMIAEKTGYNLPEEAFLAGMIHDIGRLILVVNFPGEYNTILDGSENSAESIIEREMKMGAPHTEIGAWLLERWNFDSMTIDAARYHHEPVARIKESFPLVRIVYAANDMSRMTGSSDAAFCVLKGLFSCTFPDTVNLVLQAEEEVQELADFLGLPIGEKELFPPKNEQNDDQVPELINEVKDMSLLIGVLQNLASCPDEPAILRVIQEGLNVLFDVRKVIFFLVDPDDGLLKAKVVNDQGQADSPPGLILSRHNRDSLITQSIQKNTWLSSLKSGETANLSILDQQILHLLSCEGIVCLPLIHSGETVSVIVIGVDGQEEKCLLLEEKLLKLYAGQSGLALYVEHLKQVQAKKIAAERLAATTDLARKVIHEANNPLGIMKNYLKILSSRLEQENPAQKEIQVIEEEIDRVTRILKELSDFSKSRSLALTVLNLNNLLSDIVRIVSQSLPETFNIQFQTDLPSSVPQIRSDRDALKQIFINLIKNAVEALAGRGNISIETSFVPVTTDDSRKMGGSLESGQVRIIIRDDGPGISPAVEARLFEPYSSTKGDGHSGIGLSVVYNMIKELGGSITSSSTLGQGAVFTIMLPVHSS
jgi:HD-like signal output (HDOD) protein/signal transduction histidine kinase